MRANKRGSWRFDIPCELRKLIKLVLLMSVFLAACGPKQAGAPDASTIERAFVLTPPDQKLAALYRQSCKACHSIVGTGAPLTGDRAAWEDRWKKGLPALTQSVIVGVNGMAPGGLCFSCTTADYEALIKFMADRK